MQFFVCVGTKVVRLLLILVVALITGAGFASQVPMEPAALAGVEESTSSSNSAPAPQNASGALVPDQGWEILDEPRKNDATAPSASSTPDASSPRPPIDKESLRAIVTRRKLALPLKDAHIVVNKAERRLDLYSGDSLVKSYRVALGQNPSGRKQRQGDSRTPEGRFYICTRNAKNSAFHIFLGLSYPGLPDAKRAVNSKQITWREYQIINQRLASRGRPPWETNLGGWVGIHGGSDDAFAQKKMRERGRSDWTAGCIALTNREIAEIHAATRLGTLVEIKP